MASITITYLQGSVAGQRVRLDGESLTFGRSADNDFAVPSDAASRTHGTLTATDAGWAIAITGKNPTQAGGKRVKPKAKPVALTSGDTVAIGDQDVFQVHFDADAIAASAADAETKSDDKDAVPELSEEQLAERKRKRKAKLWIGIGVYLVVMMLGFVFFSTLDPATQETRYAQQWTRAEIESEVRAPDPKRPADTFQAQSALREATAHYNQLDRSSLALYRAHEAYQRSLSYRETNTFDDGLDQLRYQEVQDKLVDQITTEYREGYDQLKGGRYAAAAQTFRRLTEVYPDAESELHKNIVTHWSQALRLNEQVQD